jgi:hypothetical protein
MPIGEATARPRWGVPGINLFRWDADSDEWQEITTSDQAPCQEACWLYRNLLLQFPEPSSYEWEEGDTRFRAERWSDAALEVARRKQPFLFGG